MMVFQEFDQLLPWQTALQNVDVCPDEYAQAEQSWRHEKALHYINKVNLTKFADSYSPHAVRRHEAARRHCPRCTGWLLNVPRKALLISG
jgi:ABC-type histidine transport system ATPase subunit